MPCTSETIAKVVKRSLGPWLEAKYPQHQSIKILLDGETLLHAPPAKRAFEAYNIYPLPGWPKYPRIHIQISGPVRKPPNFTNAIIPDTVASNLIKKPKAESQFIRTPLRLNAVGSPCLKQFATNETQVLARPQPS